MPIEVALLGNPNAGKTTVFNALTGARQRVGNWSGVTVERLSGTLHHNGVNVNVVDLPGIYSLSDCNETAAPDAQIVYDYLLSGSADRVVNILDAANLERNLYLTFELLEMGIPCIIVLNMTDIALQRHLQIDHEKLAEALQCPVIPICAHQKNKVNVLKEALIEDPKTLPLHKPFYYSPPFEKVIDELTLALKAQYPSAARSVRSSAVRLLEGDCLVKQVYPAVANLAADKKAVLEATYEEDMDILIADQRYGKIHKLVQAVVHRVSASHDTLTQKIDRVVLHRLWGVPIFFMMMYTLFLFAINLGGVFQDFFDITGDAIFVQGFAQSLTYCHAPTWLTGILAYGVGRGITTTLTFIPVIGAMFLGLSFLERCGYMPRAAFVMDRCMRAVGLPGSAFVPLIIGFGCNVPAVMATRTLRHERDRILTTLMSPFMSCGARLAIFAVFASAFFPGGAQNIVFLLYCIGIMVAILTGVILRKTLLMGPCTPLIMELPPYHWPQFHILLRQAGQRLKRFLSKAGKVIVPLCAVIGTLGAVNVHGQWVTAGEQSILAVIGQTLTPVFEPMGIHAANWPATVGLLTGTLAKEVVIATLNTLYSQVGHLAQTGSLMPFELLHALSKGLFSIVVNLQHLPHALFHPLQASAPQQDMTAGVYGVMHQFFESQAAAFAYLLFVLLYVPCVSTVAVMLKEVNRAWTILSVVWSTGIAYLMAVAFYQVATFSAHPTKTISWLVGLILTSCIGLWALRQTASWR